MRCVVRGASILLLVFLGMAIYRWSALRGVDAPPRLPIPPLPVASSAVDPLPEPGSDIWLLPVREEPAEAPPAPVAAPPPSPVAPIRPPAAETGQPQPPPPPPEPTADASLWRVYTVESGDTLGEVAERLLGTCKRWPEILEANKGILKTEKDLRLGMKIRVPPRDLPPPRAGGAPRPARESKEVRPQATAPRKTHVVRQGETLYSLARKYYPRAPVEEAIERLKAANGVSPDALPVGKVLVLPPPD